MGTVVARLRASAPDRFWAAMAIALAFVVFLVADQAHWWKLKAEYAFGWLVPLFVGYILLERWPRIARAFQRGGDRPVGRGAQALFAVLAGLGLALGGAAFLLGALYRAGAGVSQPGSLALATGFSGLLLGLVYFNAPDGIWETDTPGAGWRALAADTRLRTTALFVFPALIWLLSAPLVDAVENQLSLFLLRKVTAVVFFVFNTAGYPVMQQGNVLVLPKGEVQVAEACSGILSLTACLFAGSFLAAVFLDRWWKKVLLIAAALGLAFLTNLLRSLFLTAWAYRHGSDAINGRVHDVTGYLILAFTCAGLLALLPLFKAQTWVRWLGGAQPQKPA